MIADRSYKYKRRKSNSGAAEILPAITLCGRERTIVLSEMIYDSLARRSSPAPWARIALLRHTRLKSSRHDFFDFYQQFASTGLSTGILQFNEAVTGLQAIKADASPRSEFI